MSAASAIPSSAALATVSLGHPRIGPRRELKQALEAFWAGLSTEAALRAAGAKIRHDNWLLQKEAGITAIPSGDFSFYDHVLDHAALFGVVPARFGWQGGAVPLSAYFAMARGSVGAAGTCGCGATHGGGEGVPALELTKWFDTNYHHLVPEVVPEQAFALTGEGPVADFRDALALGVSTRPVVLGPVSFLLLSKCRVDASFRPLSLLSRLLPCYVELLRRLAEAGAKEVQVDEPCLCRDLGLDERAAYQTAFVTLSAAAPGLRLALTTGFGDLADNLGLALHLPVDSVHLDLVRAPAQLLPALDAVPAGRALSLGLVDGRNIWRADLSRALTQVELAVFRLGADRVRVGPSCSLLHAPVDAVLETGECLDPAVRPWLAFARQKLDEVAVLARGAAAGRQAVAQALAQSDAVVAARAKEPRVRAAQVRARTAGVVPADLARPSPFAARAAVQQAALQLPPLPTTTIGSFPQTPELRRVRAEFKAGRIGSEAYETALKDEVARAVREQEEAGLDVLVHGEPERNDMVEYFGGQLDGFTTTANGWVQSYGSRCVKPPVIFGDVRRRAPMTVAWARFAQSLSQKPVKGMLTGPVTILQWSFVRDDLPRSEVCRQIALAVRDEVADLEAAGTRIIQVDEPALREGLPPRARDHAAFLRWSVDAFRLATACAADATQVHTHMCYCEFEEVLGAIAEMDADVISFEASRSGMSLLGAFGKAAYPNAVGPGVWDIHSPRVPSAAEMTGLLARALEVVPEDRLWVNPDCGLKTRKWEEVRPALANLVAAAQAARAQIQVPA